MLYRKTQFPSPRIVALAFALFVAPTLTLAQHGGGGGGINASHPGAGGGRPSGVSEKDDLKDFHRILALQATADQRAAFVKIAPIPPGSRRSTASLSRISAESACFFRPLRARNRRQSSPRKGSRRQPEILASFSPAQESGLKDLTKKLQKPIPTSTNKPGTSIKQPMPRNRKASNLPTPPRSRKPWPASRPSTSRWARK